jgi:hypothetical protein
VAQLLQLVCYSEYEVGILEGAPKKRAFCLLRTRIEPWNDPKKKEDEPDNEVSKQVPRQGEEKSGPGDLKKVRQGIKDLVESKAVVMVQKILEKKGDPSYLALKYLFEIAGLYPASSAEETDQDDSLVKKLLRHLRLEDETASEVTKDKQASAPAEQKDAVK